MTIIQAIDPQQATTLKEKGNECFKRKDYEGAIQFYFEALPFCQLSDPEQSEDALLSNVNNTDDDDSDHKNNDTILNEKQSSEDNNGEEQVKETREEEEELDENDKQCREIECMVRSNLAACFVLTGAYNRAIDEASTALSLIPHYSKALFRRMQAYESLGRIEEAHSDAKLLVETNAESQLAQTEYKRLQELLEQKRKQEMDQMLSQLKDLGNSLLGKIGLSLDNFKMQKDESNGTFSINMNNK